MAMLQMQRISICALKRDRKPLLELLQRRGVVEINDEMPEDNVFHKIDMSHAKSSFEKNIQACREAIAILEHHAPEKGSMLAMLDGRTAVTVQEYEAFKEKYENTIRIAGRIIAWNKEIAERGAEIHKLKTQAELLVPWVTLDIPMNFTGTKHTRSFIGTLPGAVTLEELYLELAEYMPLNADIISSSKEQTCIFVLCGRESSDSVYEGLRRMGFAHPSIITEHAPSEQIDLFKGQIEEAEEAIRQAKQQIVDAAGASTGSAREDLKFLQDYDRMRFDKYDAIGKLQQSKNVFVLTGYIAAREAGKLEKELTECFEAAVEFEEPSEDEEVPIKLSNNAFARPLEWVLEGFSLPAKGEVDPTFSMALFYYLLFGIMFADAGYGIIMIAACAYCLIKGRNKIEGFTRDFLEMFLYCGISTVFWGVMFGSYFGDVFDVIATTYFGATKVPVIPPLWFFPVAEPIRMLTFSMALGVLHLLFALVMKIYQSARQKDYIGILYDAVSWMSLIISSIVLLLSMEMITNILGVEVYIPPVAVTVSAVIACLACAVIVLTNGRESRNPFKRFLKGLYALYGITGYLSDVLSYSRLLALGLASGVISSVINKMAAMAGKGMLGPVIFIIILLFGHTVNFAINILGAYVHTNRLEYVEFFGKFYSGGGRSFQPFGMKTKYYKVKENMNDGL
jgi:V/A-type H+-transporting ATPase subunit I